MKSILIAVAVAAIFGACVEASGYGDDSYQTYYRQPRPYYYNSYYRGGGYNSDYQPRYGADWGYWSECTASCGGGEQTRTRICYSRQQGYSGYTAGYNGGYNGGYVNTKPCGSETRECNDDPCPVDGGWSDWGDYSECSNQCGYGEKTRERTCTEPEPANGGRDCYGPAEESSHCHEYKCPVDGGWSYWGPFSYCSEECGGGEKSRERTCTHPAPRNGGADCEGDSEESMSCNEHPCRVDGGWSDWGDYSECSNQCGYGEKTRERTCTEPEPANGGRDCYGPAEESVYCHEYKCPVDGGWAYWGEFGECSASCGGGEKTRERTCTHPAPRNGGAECEGDSEESMTCNEEPCPVDGMWSEWEEFSECSVSCGGGEKSRQRYCNNPEPQYEGEDCEGDDEETMSCNVAPCPVDGEWGDWSEWSKCSGYCGEGERTRSRVCDSPAPAYEGDDCEGDDSETETCKHYIPCYAPRGYGPQGHGKSDGY